MNILSSDKANRKAWTISMVGGLFFTFYFMQMAFLNPIAQGISTAFNLNAEQLGSLSSIYLLAVGLMSIPAGIMTDKFRTRPLMLTVLGLSIVSLFVMRFISNYPALVAIRFGQGLLHTFCLLGALRLATQWIPSRQMGMASSLIITIGLLGGAITQPLFLWLYSALGLANTFLAYAFMGIMLWGLFFFVIHDNPQAPMHHASSTWRSFAQGLLESLRKLQNSVAGIYVCFLNLPLIIFGTAWGTLYLEHTFGIRGEEGSMVISMVFLGIMVGSPMAGFLSDQLHTRKHILLWGAFATFLVFALLFLLNEPSFMLIATLFFAIGFISSCQVVAYPLVAETNPPAFASTSLSVLTTVLMLGNAVCQTLFSKMVSMHTIVSLTTQEPLYTAESFHLAVWGLAISLLIAGILAITFKDGMARTLK